ncbi:MAG: RdgB/HAM1 family non-canonical purine NTP pyrophosphatase [Candidatus Fermentibacteraceae bacterium]|nr:RdgB/HAM1 family non-canonical purine NTP pyrophosphatase [Candidatus Fermentibacteraceae bacterium]MBN2608211.1 RdgB/HAM1 family non-canonical purine NTP pyrophosphatase [Candidatus Fermentibacteraceae bacterium]
MNRIILASGNPDKLEELRWLLGGLEVEVVPVRGIIPDWKVEETGATLEENAYLKARDVVRRTGMPAVADDTGLFVDILGGAPGVYAARFAGFDCTYENNIQKLLRTMLCERNRTASFMTSAVFVSSDIEFSVTGEIRGVILEEPDGDSGFGYDPVFLPDGLDHTFGRCTAEEKNRISHRALALRSLREKLMGSGFLD